MSDEKPYVSTVMMTQTVCTHLLKRIKAGELLVSAALTGRGELRSLLVYPTIRAKSDGVHSVGTPKIEIEADIQQLYDCPACDHLFVPTGLMMVEPGAAASGIPALKTMLVLAAELMRELVIRVKRAEQQGDVVVPAHTIEAADTLIDKIDGVTGQETP